jgi:protein TonB
MAVVNNTKHTAMNLFSFHKDNLDEVVFEHRNKQYGAYALRKSYDGNLLKASFSSFGVLLLFGSMFYVFTLLRSPIVPIPVEPLHVSPVVNTLSKIDYILDPPENVAAAVRNANVSLFRIVRDHFVAPTPDDIQHDPNLPDQPLGIDNGTPGGIADGTPGGTAVDRVTTGTAVPGVQFATIAEVMPSFVGGEEAMIRYLANHIVYPTWARDNGIEGKVIVSFVVKMDGSIDFIELIKGIGYGCDDEALRVIAAMPKWNVGRQNGQLRAIKMVLPIHFKLQ